MDHWDLFGGAGRMGVALVFSTSASFVDEDLDPKQGVPGAQGAHPLQVRQGLPQWQVVRQLQGGVHRLGSGTRNRGQGPDCKGNGQREASPPSPRCPALPGFTPRETGSQPGGVPQAVRRWETRPPGSSEREVSAGRCPCLAPWHLGGAPLR